MNKLIIILAVTITCLCGCTPDPAVTPTPSPVPAVSYNFIKYWRIDTLRNNLTAPPAVDSLYAFKIGDTSFIKYHGTTLYVFCVADNYNTPDSTKGIIICYLSPVCFDTTAAWSRAWVTPDKYWHTGDAMQRESRQTVQISTRSPHFATLGDATFYGGN